MFGDLVLCYDNGEHVGAGTFGLVRRSEDEKTVVKRTDKEHGLDEVHSLQMFDHPNIVPVLKYEKRAEFLYIAMPYYGAGSLSNALQNNKPLSMSEQNALTRQGLDALSDMNRKGIVHCDIKPDNLMLTRDKNSLRLVIIDFGLSYDLSRGNLYATCGAERWWPPEMYDASKAIQPSLDLWAFTFVMLNVLLKCVLKHCKNHDGRIFLFNAFCLEQGEAKITEYTPWEHRKLVTGTSFYEALGDQKRVARVLPEQWRIVFEMALRKNPEERSSAESTKKYFDDEKMMLARDVSETLQTNSVDMSQTTETGNAGQKRKKPD